MSNPPERYRVCERSSNVLLADQLRKRRRPIFARDDLIHDFAKRSQESRWRFLRNEAKLKMPDPG